MWDRCVCVCVCVWKLNKDCTKIKNWADANYPKLLFYKYRWFCSLTAPLCCICFCSQSDRKKTFLTSLSQLSVCLAFRKPSKLHPVHSLVLQLYTSHCKKAGWLLWAADRAAFPSADTHTHTHTDTHSQAQTSKSKWCFLTSLKLYTTCTETHERIGFVFSLSVSLSVSHTHTHFLTSVGR